MEHRPEKLSTPKPVEIRRCDTNPSPCSPIGQLVLQSTTTYSEGNGSRGSVEVVKQQVSMCIGDCPTANRRRSDPELPCVQLHTAAVNILNRKQ